MGIPSSWWWLFRVHAIGASGLTALVVVLLVTTPADGGANIGAGLLGLPLLPLGLPWSLLHILNPYRFDDLGDVAWLVVVFAPAMINVGIHAAVLVIVSRNRKRRLTGA